ncbi:MAG: tripartite tricarboxylate transporter TctB family protein [Aquisalimonadaceae bacterium]
MLKRVNTDLMAGLTGFAFFAIFWLAREDWRPSSAMWPESILMAIAVISTLLIARAAIKREVFEIFEEGSRLRMVGAGGGLALWGIGVHYLGFVVASAIMFPIMAWLLTRAEQRTSPEVAPDLTVKARVIWIAIIAFEIGLLYVVFSRILLVPLPKGIAF